MQTIFLKDGTQANLVTKTEQGYFIDPFIIIYGYEGEESTESSGNIKLVQEVYEKAPIELVDAEFKAIQVKIDEQESALTVKRKELSAIKHEVEVLKKQKTDLTRGIINKSELKSATRLIVFKKDRIEPYVLDAKNNLKLTVSFEISQYCTEERCWIYNLHYSDSWSSGDYFDEEYGIKCDLSDEQILELTIDRLNKKPEGYFSEWWIAAANDKWLTPLFIERKKIYLENENKGKLLTAQKKLKEAQDEIEKYTTKELTVS